MEAKLMKMQFWITAEAAEDALLPSIMKISVADEIPQKLCPLKRDVKSVV